MLKLNIENLHKVSTKNGLSVDEFHQQAELLPDFIDRISTRNQGFYQVIDDAAVISEIEEYVDSVEGKYRNIVICGVGGSALGAICLRSAFTLFFNNTTTPVLHVLENIDPDFIADLTAHLDLSKTLFLVISKSGGTPETVAQFMYFRERLESAGLPLKEHFVFITDPKESLLRQTGEPLGIKIFTIPSNVGGRFSVQTPVGLLPAALIGVNIRSLIDGMCVMRDSFLNNNFDQNLPYQLSVAQIGAYARGKNMNVIMPYHTKLRQFSAWCAQLIAESTGKLNQAGESVGITPLPALGVTDQHSQVQLFTQGPNNKLIIFIAVETFQSDPLIPVSIDHEKTNFMTDKSFKDLLNAEMQATEQALTEKDRPNITITIPELNPYYLGQLFMLFEGATAFLGEFLEINAFDQPGVERGKVLTRDILREA